MWGMGYKQKQIDYLRDYEIVITFEDHLQDAGFGSWLLEAVSLEPVLNCKVIIKALDSAVCGVVGRQDYLNEKFGLG